MITKYPFAPHVQVGDIVLTASERHPNIVYSDEVSEVWEHDEVWHIRLVTGETLRRFSDDVVTVVRNKEGMK